MTDTSLIWLLSPHGKGKNMAQWVVDNFSEKTATRAVDVWVRASQQILDAEENA